MVVRTLHVCTFGGDDAGEDAAMSKREMILDKLDQIDNLVDEIREMLTKK